MDAVYESGDRASCERVRKRMQDRFFVFGWTGPVGEIFERGGKFRLKFSGLNQRQKTIFLNLAAIERGRENGD